MSHLPPADLVAHAAFVRRLARRLARDDAEADDVAQESLSRALQNPPRLGPGLGGWFAVVVRNVVRRGRRTDARRLRREEVGARAESAPAADEAAARAEGLRRVTEAVNGLDPAAREVVWLRHYEDLPPRAIAARLGIPVETVKKRLQRAHAALRVRLADEDGGRRVLLLAGLSPRRGEVSGAAAAALGGLAMGTATKVGLAAAIAVAIGAGAWALAPRRDAGEEGFAAHSPPLATAEASLAARPPSPAAREAAQAPRPDAAAAQAPVVEEVSARVVEDENHRRTPPDVLEGVLLGAATVDGVVVTLAPRFPGSSRSADSPRRAMPSRDGVYRFDDVASGQYRITVTGPGGAVRTRSIGLPQLPEGSARQPTVFGTARIEGRCYDRLGSPVRGAHVGTQAEDWHTTGGSDPQELNVDTDAEGIYRIDSLHSGSYVLSVGLPDRDPAGVSRGERVTLGAGETRTLDFGDPRGEPTWRGATRTASGAPLRPPALILLQSAGRRAFQTVSIDDSGRIEARVPRGTHTGTLWYRDHQGALPGGFPEPFSLAVGDEDVTLDVVARGVRVSGRVRGDPVPAGGWGNVLVHLLPRDGAEERSAPWSTALAADGTFALAAVPAGAWRLGLSLPAGFQSEPTAIDVPADRDVAGVVLEVRARGK